MAVKYSKAIGANTDLLTAQAFVFQRQEEKPNEQQAQKSYLAVLVSGQGDDVFTKVRQVVPQVEEVFFEGSGPAERRIGDSLKFLTENLNTVEELQILVALWQESVLRLQVSGHHKAYLRRGGKFTDLVTKQGEMTTGFLQPGDKLLIINARQTREGIRVAWESAILDQLLSIPTDQLEDEVEMMLQRSSTSEPIAMILFENLPPQKGERPVREARDVEFVSKPGVDIPAVATPSYEDDIPQVRIDENSGEVESTENLHQQQHMLPQDLTREQPENIDAYPPRAAQLDTEKRPYQQYEMEDDEYPQLKSNRLGLPKGKMRVLALGVLVLFVALGIGSYLFFSSTSAKEKQFLSYYDNAKNKYEAALSGKDANPQEAAKNLNEAKSSLAEAQKIKPNDGRAIDLQKTIDENTGAILKISDAANLQKFLSLDLIKSGFSASRMAFSHGTLLLLSDSDQSLVTLDLENKTNKIQAGFSQLGKAKAASLNSDMAYTFSVDKGIVRVDTSSQKATQIVKADEEWGAIADVYGFAGNVYLLDSSNSKIWKYVPAATRYSDKIAYLKEGQKPDLSGSRKLFIDYSVWVLKSEIELLRFTGGVADNFSVSGLDKNIENIKSFFVTEKDDSVYILDTPNSRVVVLTKSGQYKSQIKSDQFKTASDLVVDEENKKLYLLENNIIYTLALQ